MKTTLIVPRSRVSLTTTLVAIAILAGFLTVASWADAAEWVYADSRGGIDIYYDKESLTYQATDIIRFWWKTVVTDPKYAEREKKRRIAAGIKSDGYEDLALSIAQGEINCNLKQGRLRQFADYGKDGRVLDSVSHVYDWESIVPESLMDSLMPLVCRKTVKKQGGKPSAPL